MNRRFLVVVGLVAGAHLALLGAAASRYVEPPAPQVETVRVLTGHVGANSELVATGYALARVRAVRGACSPSL